MVGPQLPQPGVAYLLQEFDRLRQLPYSLICDCQVVECSKCFGVLGPQLLNLRVAYLLEKFDRLRRLPDAPVYGCEVVERGEC